jgi:MOSC domain-containing protein YiiM
LPEKAVFYGRDITTGIGKLPVSEPARLGMLGFEGDGVADKKHHGGPDKAVCVYSTEHYRYWEDALGIKLPPAPFGENFSVSELYEEDICIGDIFQAGTALVQVSQPRQPCKTLAARYGRNDMVKLAVDSGRTGFYFRVLQKGVVKRGDILVLRERDPHNITVSFANSIFHHDKKNCEAIKRILALPSLSASWRESFLQLKDRCR